MSSTSSSSQALHFSPPTGGSPLHSPLTDEALPSTSSSSSAPSPPIAEQPSEDTFAAQDQFASINHSLDTDGPPTPLYSPALAQDSLTSNSFSNSSATRPPPPARGSSFATTSRMNLDPFGTDRARRVSYPATSVLAGGDEGIWSTAPTTQRTMRAASDGLLLSTGFGSGFGTTVGQRSREQSNTSGGDASSGSAESAAAAQQEQQERAALFREHERRSLETSAHTRLANTIAAANAREAFASPPLNSSATASSFFPAPSTTSASTTNSSSAATPLSSAPTPSLPLAAPPLLSPTSPTPGLNQDGASSVTPTTADGGAAAIAAVARATSASLHLGDLDVWMDEAYVRECCARMGWEGVTNIKMIRGASPSSGYCFLTFPTAAHAAQVLARFNASPPTLMPRSGRTFKLNWGTGLPGLQPRWEGEYSVFVGDLGREVGEAELVSLFTPIFPSTKSAKVMCDPSTGLSRGYGFVRFASEDDMHRALALGQNAGSGLSLHGRTLRISEASGPGNSISGADRDRTRTRSSEASNGGGGGQGGGAPGLSIQTSSYSGYHQQPHQQQHQQQQHHPHSLHALHQQHSQDGTTPVPGYPDFLSPTFPVPYAPNGPLSPTGQNYPSASPISPRGPLSPGFGGASSGGGGGGNGGGGGGGGGGGNHSNDPNNTTVFVGGLPACISEETLKSFFHHFGEITYCKIPTGKGCGFVQFVRRADAELAIAKMNDFPIHGKSRIRLSWGRSQGDKQVEHVRKLAAALGVPFESVWRMVQGQDAATVKQIATAAGVQGGAPGAPQQQQSTPATTAPNSQATTPAPQGPSGTTSRFESLGVGRMDLGAVASAAGLTEAEVLDLVGGRSPPASSTSAGAGSDFFTRGSGSSATSFAEQQQQQHQHQQQQQPNGAGPYSRVSPSTFSAFSSAGSALLPLPLSPPPSAGPGSSFALSQLQMQQQPYSLPSPYNSIRPDAYLVHSPNSPYERVDFAEGGVPLPQGRPTFAPRYSNGGYEGYTTLPPPNGGGAQGLEDSFANLALHSHQQPHSASHSPLPPRNLPQQHHRALPPHQQQAQGTEFFPSVGDDRTPRGSYGGAGQQEMERVASGGAGEAQWNGGWPVRA